MGRGEHLNTFLSTEDHGGRGEHLNTFLSAEVTEDARRVRARRAAENTLTPFLVHGEHLFI